MAQLSNQEVARRFDGAAAQYDACSNSYTLQRRALELSRYVEGRSLEIGGGTGAVTAALDARSQAIHADIAPRMCVVARRKLGCPSVCFDGEAIPFADRSIDTAISSEMIYYLTHPERFFAEAHRILRPGGRLLISTTNPLVTLLDRLRSLLRKFGFRSMFFDDGSPRFISLRRVQEMLSGAGFRIEWTRKIVVLPFAALAPLNRLLERTWFRHFGLFMLVAARKAEG